MFLVGLTGGIATGKSTVSRILSKEGCAIIDADSIAKQVVAKHTKGWQLVRQHFGDAICDSEGNIDRAKLGEIIFSDPTQRQRLNSITHPLIFRRMLWEALCNLVKGKRYVILDIPLLSKHSPMFSFLSEIVVVHCEEDIQIERLMQRNNFTETEAKQRISSQMPVKEKISLVTNQCCLIDNNGNPSATQNQVMKLKCYLDSSWRPEVLRCVFLSTVVLVVISLRLYMQ